MLFFLFVPLFTEEVYLVIRAIRFIFSLLIFVITFMSQLHVSLENSPTSCHIICVTFSEKVATFRRKVSGSSSTDPICSRWSTTLLVQISFLLPSWRMKFTLIASSRLLIFISSFVIRFRSRCTFRSINRISLFDLKSCIRTFTHSGHSSTLY